MGADGDLPEAVLAQHRPLERGDGNVDGIISVDVSDWYTPGRRTGMCAMECTQEEIFKEVWGQILDHIDDGSLER